jgi:transposase InsO family protein
VLDQTARQPRPLGLPHQAALRRLERQVRLRTRALARWAGAYSLAAGHVADRIGIAAQTLGDWARPPVRVAPPPSPRGRPPRPLEPQAQDQVQEVLEENRGRLGLPTLKDLFPLVPRTLLQTLRDQYRAAHAPWPETLTWTRPGSVWSADFTYTPMPIEDRYPYLLSVRDLASSYHLLAWPVENPVARITLQALRFLAALYPLPLVLKTDNGSHFIDDTVAAFLVAHQIAHLRSPPLTPEYNGSQEAGIGVLKTRILHLAAAAGRIGFWTCDDVEAARLEANYQGRPFRSSGPTPHELWQPRLPILPDERTAFLQAVALAAAAETRKLLGPASDSTSGGPALTLNASQRAIVTRRAIRRALVERGYLTTRRTPN